MSQNEKTVKEDAKFRRSPSFPIIPIDEAIDRARRIYREDRRAFTSFETLAGHLGYTVTKKGGRPARAVSALKQYGLLDERNGQYRISDLAWKILEMDAGAPERERLIKEAALSPPMFRKILKFYDGELPSDATLRHHLLFQEKFNTDGARDFITVLRRTIELVNPTKEDYNTGEETDEAGEQPQEATPMSQQSTHVKPLQTPIGKPPLEVQRQFARQAVNELALHGVDVERLAREQAAQKELRFNISRNSEARVIFSGAVTQEAITKLAALLELSKDTFPTQAELEQPRRAIWRNKDHDQPVVVTGEAGEHEGRRYVKIEGSDAGVPEDELDFEEQ